MHFNVSGNTDLSYFCHPRNVTEAADKCTSLCLATVRLHHMSLCWTNVCGFLTFMNIFCLHLEPARRLYKYGWYCNKHFSEYEIFLAFGLLKKLHNMSIFVTKLPLALWLPRPLVSVNPNIRIHLRYLTPPCLGRICGWQIVPWWAWLSSGQASIGPVRY